MILKASYTDENKMLQKRQLRRDHISRINYQNVHMHFNPFDHSD